MRTWEQVVIIGVGLIGGSIGLALKRAAAAGRIVGVGRRASSLQRAKRRGAVDSTSTNVQRAVAGADLVVVCTPVERIAEYVMQVDEVCSPGTLITDAGSTKQQLIEQVDAAGKLRHATFIGSHPLAGSEKKGPAHARADLFDDRMTVVTPTRRDPQEHVDRVVQFWESLGSRTCMMTPAAHDAALAQTSHLPHVVSAVLAATTSADLLHLVAGGWRDTTRIAGGDADLWQQILLSNRRHVLKSLDKFGKVLNSFRKAIEADNAEQLENLLSSGKEVRDALGS